MSASLGLTSFYFLPFNNTFLIECKAQTSVKVFINPSSISSFLIKSYDRLNMWKVSSAVTFPKPNTKIRLVRSLA